MQILGQILKDVGERWDSNPRPSVPQTDALTD